MFMEKQKIWPIVQKSLFCVLRVLQLWGGPAHSLGLPPSGQSVHTRASLVYCFLPFCSLS